MKTVRRPAPVPTFPAWKAFVVAVTPDFGPDWQLRFHVQKDSFGAGRSNIWSWIPPRFE